MIEVDCNLCGANDWHVKFPATAGAAARPDVSAFRCTSRDYGSHAQIVQCNRCGLVYSNPRWPAGDLAAAYAAVEDEVYVREREGRELTFEGHLGKLEQFTGPADGRTLLDVGAYIGVFVEVARDRGWLAEGIEPSDWAVARARERGLPVHLGTQDSPVLAGRVFDVITLWDVIEHLPDPTAELRQAYKLLAPGGWMAVHTMDVGSLTARLLGRRWPWLMDMHLYYFSRKTLAQMLQKCGFEIAWSGTEGRYLRLGYISSRLGGLNRLLGDSSAAILERLNLDRLPVRINSGDLFTIYARRPR